jgi:hypothetical protein
MASAGKAARQSFFSKSPFVVGANFQRPSAKSRSQESYSSSESQRFKAEATHSFLSKHRELTPSILRATRTEAATLCSLFFSLRLFYLTDGKKNFVARRSTTKRKSKHQRRPYTNLQPRTYFSPSMPGPQTTSPSKRRKTFPCQRANSALGVRWRDPRQGHSWLAGRLRLSLGYLFVHRTS